MRAVVYERFGPPEVLEIREVDKPAPKENEVLVKVHATTVTSGDRRVRSLDLPSAVYWLPGRLMFGFSGPRKQVLGMEAAGKIEAVGRRVTRFHEGDRVYAFNGVKMGMYAEYICVPEDGVLAKKPVNTTYEEAAAIPFGATCALYYLRQLGGLQSGQKVLIVGASGGVGTAAVQLARYFGADVTGVCSTANLELVESLGADRVVDYTREDYAESGRRYDLIFDTVGGTTVSHGKRALAPGGTFLANVMTVPELFQILWTSVAGGQRVKGGVAPEKAEDLVFFKELVEQRKLRAVIDRRFPLDQIVEAHRYVDSGRKRGNVVVSVAASSEPRQSP